MTKQKIIFLDIDGPMIPGRAYHMPTQTKGIVKTFDPCAVGLLNKICSKSGWRIVLHSSWIQILGGEETHSHCISQGIPTEHFHDNAWCDENVGWRYTRVAKWLNENPDTTHYFILDDEPYRWAMEKNDLELHPKDIDKHLILVDFEDGILTSTMNKISGGNWKV